MEEDEKEAVVSVSVETLVKCQEEKMASMERLLCDMIVTHGQRERTLLNQIAALHSDIKNRSLTFQQTLAHYQRHLRQLKSKKDVQDFCDSDSGVGEDQTVNVHLAVILSRKNGSLGFNVSGGGGGDDSRMSTPPSSASSLSSTSQTTTKELVVCKVNPDGPAHGKLCLQDRILKVNGIDLSLAGHDEAVNVIKLAQEPLVIEVVRQLCTPWPRLCDATSQTDMTLIRIKSELNQDEPIDLSRELKKYDMEYEEIVLSTETKETKLGLIICYTQDSETSTDIFIEQVDPDGVAGRDGRIKQGDQVVRVNGVDVQDRKQAEELFECRNQDVSLVVARPRLKKCDEDGDDGQMSSFQHYRDCDHPQVILEEADGLDSEGEEEEEELKQNHISAYDAAKTIHSKENAASQCGSGDEKEQKCDKLDVGPIADVADAVDSLVLDESESNIDSLSKSRAVELWVKSTATTASVAEEQVRPQISATELCRRILLPPPPPPVPNLDYAELSSVACDCCRPRSDQLSFVMPGSSCASLSTLYTNRHNLNHTIQLQQQLFQQALLASSSSSSSSGRSPSSASTKTPLISSDVPSGHFAANTEWKVKKRSDGSRYIMRRPVRSRLLKERASRLAEERCGITTDDDAVSEMKAGRYWNKEDRKRHLERAKEHRQRKEELLRSLDAGKTPSDKGILELSRRKVTRIRGKNLFDNFTTVQEVLAHGSHSRTDGKAPHRLLSVTTV